MGLTLSAAGLTEIDAVMARYPVKQAAILPLFHVVQREHGYVSAEAEEWIAAKLDMAPVKVHEVLTFYSMLHTRPVGRLHLQVCRTLSCALRGAGKLLRHLESRHGLTNHAVSADRDFSLDEVECLGACGNAPVVQINDDYHLDLTPEKLDSLMAEQKANLAPGGR